MHSPFRLTALVVLVAAGAAAQEPLQLRYRGDPLQAPFTCTREDFAEYGLRCSVERPCPIYLEVTSVAAVDEKVFVAGSFHDGSFTLASVLLRSEDGGQSWEEIHERLRGVGIDMVHFLDENNGWATGHVVSFSPRDPFFLITTDGGAHWRRRDVFPDGGIGRIEQFWFDDAQSGSLLVDRIYRGDAGGRYERYETMTGGANWMIREVSSTPIRVRNAMPAAADPNWRYTPDRERGAWQIEQRQPGGWARVAEFSIEVGLCTPPQEVASAPEPPPEPGAAEASAEGELPTAPGGVFVIGSPQPRTRPQEEPPDSQ